MQLAPLYRGYILLSLFLIVDCFLIWWVNFNARSTGFIAAPIASGDQPLVTYALVGAAAIATLVTIFYKVKPVPATFRR